MTLTEYKRARRAPLHKIWHEPSRLRWRAREALETEVLRGVTITCRSGVHRASMASSFDAPRPLCCDMVLSLPRKSSPAPSTRGEGFSRLAASMLGIPSVHGEDGGHYRRRARKRTTVAGSVD